MNYLFNQTLEAVRMGKHNRVNPNRFFHIMNQGWFLYMRDSLGQMASTNTKDSLLGEDNIAGPFESKRVAKDYLSAFLYPTSTPSSVMSSELPLLQDSEDWRY